MQKIEILRNMEIFRGLTDDDLAQISPKLRERVYPRNCAIFREGASGEAMCIIKSGQVEIKKRDETLGTDITIATLGTGAIFGEADFITGNPRSTMAIAIAPTEILFLTSDVLFEYSSVSSLVRRILRNWQNGSKKDIETQYEDDH